MNNLSDKFMMHAIKLSVDSVNNNGGPFGCVIVKDNQIIGEGSNKVVILNDPTAHGEIIAIKDRSLAGVSVPAHALFLTEVQYPKSILYGQ